MVTKTNNRMIDGAPANVLDFGAVGDGITDNLTAFQNLRDAYPQGATLNFPAGMTFYCSERVNFTGAWFINGNGSTILFEGLNAFSFTNPVHATYTLTRDAATSYFYGGELDGVERGDLFVLESDTLWEHDNRGTLHYGELNQIAEVATNGNIHVGSDEYNGELVFPTFYTVASNSRVTYYKNRTLRINDLQFKGMADSLTSALNITGYTNPILDNVTIADCTVSGMSVTNCFSPSVRDLKATNISPSGSTGYGVQFNGCRHGTVTTSTFLACRRGVDYSGEFPSIGGGVYSSYADGCGGNTGSAFGTHGTAYNIIFDGNTLGTNQYGFVARGEDIVITNNVIEKCNVNVVHATAGSRLKVLNNSVNTCQRMVGLYNEYLEFHTDVDITTMNETVITGNNVESAAYSFVGFQDTSSQKSLYGYVIRNNTVRLPDHGNFRAAITAVDTTTNLTGFTFGNGCNLTDNDIIGVGHYNGVIDRGAVFEGYVAVDTVSASQVGTPITITRQGGSGTIANVTLDLDYLSLNYGRITGDIILRFEVQTASVTGIIVNTDWIKRPTTTAYGRYNPLYYQVGFLDSLGFAQARLDGQLYVGYGTTGVAGTFAVGSYVMSIKVDVLNPDYSSLRPQGD